MLTHRLVPVAGACPTPGKDATGAPWLGAMRGREVALFCFDAATGTPLSSARASAGAPAQPCAVVYANRVTADAMMRGIVARDPRLRVALYDRRGRMLATAVRGSIDERRMPLGMPLPMVRLVLTIAALAAGFLTASYLFAARGGGRLAGWPVLSPWQRIALVAAGVGFGASVVLGLVRDWLALRAWRSGSVLPAFGTPQRERLYEKLAQRPIAQLPAEITLEPAEIRWSDAARYGAWAKALGAARFERLGGYRIPELGVFIEFWLDGADELTATVIDHPRAGLWLSATSRYDDGTAYSVANRAAPGTDQNPKFRTDYIGADASAEDVIAHARDDRPPGPRRRPTPDNALEDYRIAWEQGVRWRSQRGVTAEEYRRADARLHAGAGR